VHMSSSRPAFAVPVVLLLTAVLTGCGRQSPMSPTGDSLMVSGYVYREMTAGSGEPALGDVMITLRDADGAESTAVSDRRGFYRVRAAAGEVVISAAKEGYSTRESRFEVTDSTVLNFSLSPLP
jgi:hypothetical protein